MVSTWQLPHAMLYTREHWQTMRFQTASRPSVLTAIKYTLTSYKTNKTRFYHKHPDPNSDGLLCFRSLRSLINETGRTNLGRTRIDVRPVAVSESLIRVGKPQRLNEAVRTAVENVRFEVYTAVTMKNVVFWNIKTQFVRHRRHITSPLHSPAS
jgi:hypothetical protein